MKDMPASLPALIDPLATMLSTEIYLLLQERLHPNVPLIDALGQVMQSASPEQRTFILGRARIVHELSGAVVEAASGTRRQ